MTITISNACNQKYVYIYSKDPRFKKSWGYMKCHVSRLYENMCQIAFWCNNTIGVECTFEVE